MFSDNSVSITVIRFRQAPEGISETLISSILNLIGLLSVLFGKLSFWFSSWVNPVRPARVKRFQAKTAPHFLGIFSIEFIDGGLIYPQPMRFRWTVKQNLSYMCKGNFKMPRFSTRPLGMFKPTRKLLRRE